MKKKKSKSSTPRRKRVNREIRLKWAKKWMKEYNGKNLIAGYAKWFGVNKGCAIKELRMLGVDISKEKEKQIQASSQANSKLEKLAREERESTFGKLFGWDENFAFIAGFTLNGVPYGVTHEEYESELPEENNCKTETDDFDKDSLPF